MNAKSYTSTKTYRNLPCAHRQWKNQGHCSFVHGYSREFIFHFASNELDKHGWVVDFGGLKDLKVFLEHWFDHNLLLAEDDPLLEEFRDLESKGACDLRILESASIEYSAKFVYEFANELIRKTTNQRAWCYRVEVRETDKNSAIYCP
ncbi:MAG: 6-carboxytetrahydropterin synthase [Candidatus Thermoplasmatota archaeon]|nr:6-carboxytetrahydropterin synthase [Candidatus Thermoplasmatota archaeon]